MLIELRLKIWMKRIEMNDDSDLLENKFCPFLKGLPVGVGIFKNLPAFGHLL
jgi:hypothetical protein